MSTTVAEALRDAQHALDNWSDPGCKVALRELVAALTTQPAEDVRELVAKAVCEADDPTLDYERKWPSETDEVYSDEPWRYYLGIADRIIATGIPVGSALAASFEVRPHGTVTDAEVEAAWLAWDAVSVDDDPNGWLSIRAALEAAREVHP